MMQIRAIGVSEVQIGQSRITPDSVVLFALALYLGLTAGTRTARSHLLDLLWPGCPETVRRQRFRQLLYRLRQSGLEIALDGDELLVDPAHVDSDLAGILDDKWPDEASADSAIAAGCVLPNYLPPMPELHRDWLDGLRATDR